MKAVTINGVEIEKLVPDHDTGILDIASADGLLTIALKINELLEALADKEETILDDTLLGKAKWTIAEGDTVYSYDLEKEGIDVYNKCRRCYFEAKDKVYPYIHTCKEEPKPTCQKENGFLMCYCGKCKPDYYPLPTDFLKEPKSTHTHSIPLGKDRYVTYDGGETLEKYPEPKSTLRENGTEIVYEYLRESGITFNTIDSKQIADKIISLFKDTLLKEIELLDDHLMYIHKKDITNLIKNL